MVTPSLEISPNVFYTPEEAGAMLRVSPARVRRLLKTGAARGVKIGRAWRVLGSDLLQLPRAREDSDADLSHAFMRLTEPAFAYVWDNDEDAVYDTL